MMLHRWTALMPRSKHLTRCRASNPNPQGHNRNERHRHHRKPGPRDYHYYGDPPELIGHVGEHNASDLTVFACRDSEIGPFIEIVGCEMICATKPEHLSGTASLWSWPTLWSWPHTSSKLR
jgi:hypothetical protein